MLAFARHRHPHDAGFMCLPRECDVLSPADATRGLLPEAQMCSAPVTHRRLDCGPPFRGWQEVALVMQLPAAPKSLFSELRKQLGTRVCIDDELSCVPGVWWADGGLTAAPLYLVQDCTAPPCVAPPREVDALRRRGINVAFSWFECTSGAAGGNGTVGAHPRCDNLWAKLVLLLRAAHAGTPRLQFVLKLDIDTLLFPSRMLAFLRTLSVAAGAHQALYFGTHHGANASYFQGHAYGLNGEALARLTRVWGNDPATGVPADGLAGWNEDALLGAAAGAAGAHLVHCGHFMEYAPVYVKPAGALVYPLPTAHHAA
jgi:hypothetical protein